MEPQIHILTASHDRKAFDCGVASMNDWLQRTAKQHQERDIARTFVAVNPDGPDPNRIQGYYSLSATQVVTAEGSEVLRGLPKTVPAVLLGRLAVDTKERGKGIGEELLMDALERVMRTGDTIGVRGVIVDPLDDDASRFYAKYGFVPLQDPKRPGAMFIHIGTIRQLV